MHYMGGDGAGHFVKTVHNGIEYAEMQIIAEIYTILKKGMGLNNAEIADIFSSWLEKGHRSFLLDITIKILKQKKGEEDILNHIVDIARDKGTGSWSIQAASIFGLPVPTIIEALNARHISAFIEARKKANSLYQQSSPEINISLDTLANAYMSARIIILHQGFHLIDEASKRYNWDIKLETVAQTWLSGCIIQSELMEEVVHYLKQNRYILNAENIVRNMQKMLPDLAKVVSQANIAMLYIPCFSASLNYFIGYTEVESSANLVQAQRDFFGAHKVLLKDDSSETPTHINWSK